MWGPRAGFILFVVGTCVFVVLLALVFAPRGAIRVSAALGAVSVSVCLHVCLSP